MKNVKYLRRYSDGNKVGFILQRGDKPKEIWFSSEISDQTLDWLNNNVPISVIKITDGVNCAEILRKKYEFRDERNHPCAITDAIYLYVPEAPEGMFIGSDYVDTGETCEEIWHKSEIVNWEEL